MLSVPKVYFIDVIEGCNLRCPSCPVGNMRGTLRPKGRMSIELFNRILDKIKLETPEVQFIGLFSWSEPLLHPEIGELVRSVKRHDFPCYLSANLNRTDNLESVIQAGVDSLRVSLSGFYQDTYSQTHEGGDIETVKRNMRELRALIDKHQSKTKVFIAYHRYRHNMGRDYDEMCRFADELGFVMDPTWAYLMPLEKLFIELDGKLSEKDRKVVDLFAISPTEQRRIYAGSRPSDCSLRRDQMAINADGSVSLCCAVYDKQNYIADQFLDIPYAELQRRKYSSTICERCMSNDLHKVVTMEDPEALDAIGWRNLGRPIPWHVQIQTKMMRRMRRTVQRARIQLQANGTWRALTSRVGSKPAVEGAPARRSLPQYPNKE